MMNYQELLHSPIIPSQIATLAQKAAQNNAPALIQGEQGTGKELIAKIIHHAGGWKYYGFYRIDCKFLTENKFSEQLFHLFKEINYGTSPATIYLKEVGCLGQMDQVKLLELIEDGVFQNGIGKKIIKNLRFISSSSEDLKEKILQGKFSEDLYHQLVTQSILIPPLRNRTKEIPSIAEYILAEHSKKMNIGKKTISNHVLMSLQNYWWPGNLRELEHVIVRSAIFSEGETLMEKDLFIETENEENSFISFLKKSEMKSPALQSKSIPEEQNTHSLSLFLIELVHRIKNPLVSIKTFTQLLREKFGDMEFRDYFYRIVIEDIEKIDSVLNGLLNYIKVNTPIEKTDTVHFILEDVLKRNADQLEGKKIRIFKKFEKDLPETIVHDEQLRYILNSLLQYAIPSIPPSGSIGFLTKSFNMQEETSGNQTFMQKDERYIEIIIVFTGYKKATEAFETVLGVPAIRQEEAVELELRLIKEIIQKNRGTMKFEINGKKPRTLISLRLPIERRKVISYQSTNA
jgi:nitrogen-specific signal transduction histidine kinase